MKCSCALQGISPRVEFSTKTIIQQTVTPLLEPWDLDVSYRCICRLKQLIEYQ